MYEAIKNSDGSKAEHLLKEHITKDLNFSLSKLRFLEQD
ncbi:hypothetical protein AB3Q54_03790 [Ligilactobacillus agilis]